MKRVLSLTLLTIPLLVLAKEPSAFLAGDLNQEVPYGLTKNEQIIHEQKTTISSLKKQQRKISVRLEQMEQSVDGMRSLYEGVSEQTRNTKNSISPILNELQSLVTNDEKAGEKSQVLQKRVEALQQSLELYAGEQNKQIEQLKALMRQMSGMIDSINGSYVESSRFETLENDFNDFKSLVAKELRSIADSVKEPEDLSSQDNFALFEKAKKLRKQKDYRRAIKYYEHLIKNHFKPAASNFYMAESYYSLKEFSNAIIHFKTSAKRYDKASYMPTLLLHTAYSFQRTKDLKNAKIFYNALIDQFPSTSEAKEAKKLIKKLK